MSKKYKKLIPAALIAAGIVMLIIGISRGEMMTVFSKGCHRLSRVHRYRIGGAMKTNNPRRHLVQLIATFMTNPHVSNFTDGTIHKGKSKSFCSPGLNCYFLSGSRRSVPYRSTAVGRKRQQIPHLILRDGFFAYYWSISR